MNDHYLIDGTLIRIASGIVARCSCGWISIPHFNSFTASVNFRQHQNDARTCDVMNDHMTFWYGLADGNRNEFADHDGHIIDFGVKHIQVKSAEALTRAKLGSYRAVPIPCTGANKDWIDE